MFNWSWRTNNDRWAVPDFPLGRVLGLYTGISGSGRVDWALFTYWLHHISELHDRRYDVVLTLKIKHYIVLMEIPFLSHLEKQIDHRVNIFMGISKLICWFPGDIVKCTLLFDHVKTYGIAIKENCVRNKRHHLDGPIIRIGGFKAKG